MDLPRSSLLSTLQQFLPEIEEANRKTARLAADGKLDVLDSNLEVASSGGGECDNSVRDETDGEDDEEGSAGEHREETNEERTDGRTVQLVRISSYYFHLFRTYHSNRTKEAKGRAQADFIFSVPAVRTN